MKTVFVTLSRGSFIRNFFHTGIVPELLRAGVRVVVLSPFYDNEKIFAEFAHDNLRLEPLFRPQSLRLHALMLELFKGASFNTTVHMLYRNRSDGRENPNRLWYLPRMLFFAPLRCVPGAKRLVREIDYLLNPKPEHDYLFEKYKPDLVFATSPQSLADVGVLKSARRFGVRAIDMPKSWDNPSLSLFPVKTEKTLVWGSFMKKQMRALQGYREEEIVEVGVPQFDIYHDRALRVPRGEFCRKFNFDPKKKIILYGSNGIRDGNEPRYVELVEELVQAGILNDANILVRPHTAYTSDKEQYLYLEKKYPNVAVDVSARQNPALKDKWDTSREHTGHLYNSLFHADVCINIVSTLTLDALAVGTPVINIFFDADGDADAHHTVRRFYNLAHVRAILDAKFSWPVENEDEYRDVLMEILERETVKPEEATNGAIAHLVHKNDGSAAKRVVDEVLKAIAEN